MIAIKIREATQIYRSQIQEYQAQKRELTKQKQNLQNKINVTPNGQELFASEAASLELSLYAINEKQSEYQDYVDKLTEQWVAKFNAVASEQQSDAMEEYVRDLGKIMVIARRLMHGDIVPASDEKKLMEYSDELYQAAKNIGALAQKEKREKYDSLWGDEEKKEYEDPAEAADEMEVACDGPELVEVSEVMANAVSEQ